MKFNLIALAALLNLSATEAYKLSSVSKHACDFLDENGEEISSSLIDNENSKPIEISNV